MQSGHCTPQEGAFLNSCHFSSAYLPSGYPSPQLMKTLPSPLGRFIAIATCSFLIGHATAQPTVKMGTNFPCSELMVTLQPTDGNCIDIPPYLPYTQDLALYPDLNYQLPSGTHLQSITITYNGSLLYHW